MAFVNITSPHAHGGNTTSRIMLLVILATVPGIIALTYFFGWGNLINIALASITALACEAIVLKIRKRPVMFVLKDNTALLTAVLLGIALPPFVPWWVTVVAVSFSMIFAKHLYGGLGNNPFNPAMVGYALVLISFPVQMTTTWASPFFLNQDILSAGQTLSLTDTLSVIFSSAPALTDGYSGATPLDTYKHLAKNETAIEILQGPLFADATSGGSASNWFAGGWEFVNIAFLIGGLALLALRIFTWHIPFSLLAALGTCSMIFGWDADLYVPWSLHIFTGATMLGAFFIATDPVSASTTPLGKIIFGAGIGILIFVIRTWGAYPDAVAFAVLLMNFAAPLIDTYTQPRTYGHDKAKRGLLVKESASATEGSSIDPSDKEG
ncbi:MAG: electron transport complex protein RnfD [Oleispira sp.]|jgi:electron transport complex protein RnfD